MGVDNQVNSGRGQPHSMTQAKTKAKLSFAPAYGVRLSPGALAAAGSKTKLGHVDLFFTNKPFIILQPNLLTISRFSILQNLTVSLDRFKKSQPRSANRMH
jgi:hypothetical protein